MPDWYERFVAWTTKPSPTGTWLYRGQAACYPSVLPLLVRTSRRFYADHLFDLSTSVVRTLLSGAPAIAPQNLHRDVGEGQPQPFILYELRRFGVATPDTDEITRSEILRGLAQHYDFPTLYVDVTFEPLVAAFFASYKYHAGGYAPLDAPSVVMRWPARRTSATRLDISLEGEAEHREWGAVSVVDIRRANPLFCRPTNQSAALAKPIFRPPGVVDPGTLHARGGMSLFSFPLSDLYRVDMLSLRGCDVLELPPGAGQELAQRTCVCPDALFPNRIDLGYSALSVMAYLSMVAHDPDQWGVDRNDEPQIGHARALWRLSTAAGAAVLDKEQSRLVPGYRPTRKDRTLSQWELEQTFERMTEAAIQVLEAPRPADKPLQEKLLRAANDELRRRQDLMNEVNAKTLGDDGRPLSERFPCEPPAQYKMEGGVDPFEPARAIAEIRRRAHLVRPVLRDAINTPVYALLDPDRWQDVLASTDRTVAYEREVLSQHRASTAWRRHLGHEPEGDVR